MKKMAAIYQSARAMAMMFVSGANANQIKADMYWFSVISSGWIFQVEKENEVVT